MWVGIFILGVCVGILGAFFIVILPNQNASQIERAISNGILRGFSPEQLVSDWKNFCDYYKYVSFNRERLKKQFLKSFIHSIDHSYLSKMNKVTSFQTIADWHQYVVEKGLYLNEKTDFEYNSKKWAALYFQYSIISLDDLEYLIENWKGQRKLKMDKIDDSANVVEEFKEQYSEMNRIRSFFEGNAVQIQGVEQALMRGITDAFVFCLMSSEKKICSAINEYRQHIEGKKVKFSQISQMLKDEMIPLKVRVKIEDAYTTKEVVST